MGLDYEIDRIAFKYDIPYGKVYDLLLFEQVKLFRRSIKENGFFYTLNNKDYKRKALDVVDRYYKVKNISPNSVYQVGN